MAVADVMGDVGQREWSEENMGSLAGLVKNFNAMLVKRFGKHCKSPLFTLTYHLLGHMVECTRIF